jgi:hypothetical protein
VLGVAVLIGPDALVDLDGQTWGKIAILGAEISYSLAWIYGQRLKNTPLLSRLPEYWLAPVFDITLGPDF